MLSDAQKAALNGINKSFTSNDVVNLLGITSQEKQKYMLIL